MFHLKHDVQIHLKKEKESFSTCSVVFVYIYIIGCADGAA